MPLKHACQHDQPSATRRPHREANSPAKENPRHYLELGSTIHGGQARPQQDWGGQGFIEAAEMEKQNRWASAAALC